MKAVIAVDAHGGDEGLHVVDDGGVEGQQERGRGPAVKEDIRLCQADS